MSDKMEKNQDDTEGFDFIREKIKEKPINKKKILIGLLINLIFAIVFGIVSCAAFVLAKPYFNKVLSKNENPTINIPEDEQEVAIEETPDEVVEEEVSEPEQPDPVVVTKPLEIDDYLNLESNIYDIGFEANKSIVTVLSLRDEQDMLNTTYENANKSSGIIISADQELIVVTGKDTLEDANNIIVSFSNGESVKANLRKVDLETGIAILAIPLDGISEAAKETYKAATLGNSYSVRQGTPVIALGNFNGNINAIAAGNVIASSGVLTVTDIDFTMLATNIQGSGQAGGVIINFQGEVIGIFLKDYSSSGGQSTVTALSISELKGILERLSNNQEIPHIGMLLNTVTSEAEQQYNLPKGVYVSDIITDTPAMNSGIQRGDIIIKFNDKEIVTTNDFEEQLFACSIGEEVELTVARRTGEDEFEEIECNTMVDVLK